MSDNDRWVEITVNTSHEAVEAVTAIFSECGIRSVSIEDPADIINRDVTPDDWDYIEESLLPKDNGEVKVKGYVMCNEGMCSEKINTLVRKIQDLIDKLGNYGIDKGKGSVSRRLVREEDWANLWKKYYKPFKIGEHIVIKPSWESYEPEDGDIIIELDPGMAFGTGSHETTRMCIEFLQEYIKHGFTVYDIGCGSGILSIASSKLGAKKVVGIDIDEVALKSSVENVKRSKAANVEIKRGNLLDLVYSKANIIVANIIADVIINLNREVPKFLESGGIFICSGIINERLEDVKNSLDDNGFEIMKIKKMGEWAAIAARVRE